LAEEVCVGHRVWVLMAEHFVRSGEGCQVDSSVGVDRWMGAGGESRRF
jgi:hypothetical protein